MVALSELAPHMEENVLVEGRIAEVCPTAGCWCVLEDGGSRLHVTLVTFVLPRCAEGERCRVAGKLVMQEGRPTLMATGLEILWN